MIACSVIIHKDIIEKIGRQLEIKMGWAEINGQNIHIDYEYWLRALKYTDSVYLEDICFYYDNEHGDGQNYQFFK